MLKNIKKTSIVIFFFCCVLSLSFLGNFSKWENDDKEIINMMNYIEETITKRIEEI